jgi:hypothetical protein
MKGSEKSCDILRWRPVLSSESAAARSARPRGQDRPPLTLERLPGSQPYHLSFV